MKYEIPCVFDCLVQKNDGESLERGTYGRMLEIEIREVSEDSATKVARWTEAVGGPRRFVGIKVGGAFFRSAFHANGEFVTTTSIDDRVIDTSPEYDPATASVVREGLMVLDDDFVLEHSGRDQAIERLLGRAKDLVIYEGLLFERAAEPVIAVTENGRGKDRSFEIAIVARPPGTKPRSATLHFGLTDMEFARDWIKARCRGEDFEDIAVTDTARVELAEGAVGGDDHLMAHDVALGMRAEVDDTRESLGRQWDSYIDAWQAMRAAVGKLERDSCEANIQDAVNAWSAFLDEKQVAGDRRNERFGLRTDFKEQESWQAFERVYRRWENYPFVYIERTFATVRRGSAVRK